MVGQSIGSYHVLRQLGTGAMGEVYLAEHRHLKRKAAVKLLARELVGRPDLLERFFLEARATSAIAHPGIVQVFDCEIDPTGRPYIVMEYLEGETLAALLARRGALPPATAAKHARAMAEALAAAHETGIVHRDLKPENVFVLSRPSETNAWTELGSAQRSPSREGAGNPWGFPNQIVKIVDFGIAKLEGEFRAGQVHQTRSGALMGTPLYMSPEQCRDSANLDFRTDLYSLGCVLYEMLTGRPPFTHTTLGDLVVAHMTEPPRDARELNPGVPAPLADLLNELLRKDPASRPANMRAVAERLNAFAAELTTVPEPAPVLPAAPKPPSQTTFGDAASEIVDDGESAPRRRPLTFALVAAIVVGLGVGGVIARRGGAPAKPRTKIAAAWTDTATPPATAATGTAPAPAAAASDDKEAHAHHAAKKESAGGKHASGHRVLATAPPADPMAAGTVPPAATPATTPLAAASAVDPPAGNAPGSWEGAWNDPDHHQHGRLYLQVAAGGGAVGWFSNANAAQSYRLTGRGDASGVFTLTCECPANQGFTVRAALHDRDGELRGRLTLSASSGVFGQSHVALHRAPAR